MGEVRREPGRRGSHGPPPQVFHLKVTIPKTLQTKEQLVHKEMGHRNTRVAGKRKHFYLLAS